MTSDDLAQQWARWMRSAGMSSRTINERVRLVGRLEAFAEVSSVDVGWEPIADFLATDHFEPGTRQTYYNNLRAWFRWLALMDHRVDDPTIKLPSPKTPHSRPRPVTIGQLTAMLQLPGVHSRTRVMILLGAYQGMRVSEIARIRGEHFRGDQLFVRGKGGRDDEIPVHPLVAAIAEVMPQRGYWFPSHVHAGKPITGKAVSRMISFLMRRCGLPAHLTPHSLRHFFGTETLRAVGNLVVVKELMRHASIATTERYTLVETSQRRAAVELLPTPAMLQVQPNRSLAA